VQSDGRYFCWVLDPMPWMEPRYTAQLILDADLHDFAFQQNKDFHNKDLRIAKHPLSVEEYGMTLAALCAKYPAPSIDEVGDDGGQQVFR
jgi:hypothetical protein